MRYIGVVLIFAVITWVVCGIAVMVSDALTKPAAACGTTNGWSNNTCHAGHGWSNNSGR